MKILVVGSGGREHALAWRLATSRSVDHVTVAPGNPGIALDPKITTSTAVVTPEDVRAGGYDLVVIGPEAPLVEGFADRIRAVGIPVVGPGREAARLEGSKAFAKDFMRQSGIRTAEHRVCRTVDAARRAVEEFGVPVVVKADGLAAGKGVSVCDSPTQAQAAIETIMRDRLFGDAGDTVVVERFLSGFEASVIVMVDETHHLTLPAAQDHKQIGEGGTGANTGGMGAIAPNPSITGELAARIEREIVVPSVQAIQSTGWTFRGFLFIGLMIDDNGPRVLEYNVRFGDPEAQTVLPLVEGDFGVLLAGLAEGRLADAVERSGYDVRDGAACTVVAASGGYPGPYTTGQVIEWNEVPAGSDLAGTTELFFAGVGGPPTDPDTPSGGAPSAGADTTADPPLRTAGGRVLAATGTGATLADARRRAYGRLLLTAFDGMRYRRDIGGPDITASVVEDGDVVMVQFRKRGGLVPVVVQEIGSEQVLMVGYANARAVAETRRTGYATFWSTSRSEIWTKGATSGDWLAVREIRVDCDQDALLYRVELEGAGVCHTRRGDGTPRHRCFYRSLSSDGSLVTDEP